MNPSCFHWPRDVRQATNSDNQFTQNITERLMHVTEICWFELHSLQLLRLLRLRCTNRITKSIRKYDCYDFGEIVTVVTHNCHFYLQELTIVITNERFVNRFVINDSKKSIAMTDSSKRFVTIVTRIIAGNHKYKQANNISKLSWRLVRPGGQATQWS